MLDRLVVLQVVLAELVLWRAVLLVSVVVVTVQLLGQRATYLLNLFRDLHEPKHSLPISALHRPQGSGR